jgi:hypothetical protein
MAVGRLYSHTPGTDAHAKGIRVIIQAKPLARHHGIRDGAHIRVHGSLTCAIVSIQVQSFRLLGQG